MSAHLKGHAGRDDGAAFTDCTDLTVYGNDCRVTNSSDVVVYGDRCHLAGCREVTVYGDRCRLTDCRTVTVFGDACRHTGCEGLVVMKKKPTEQKLLTKIAKKKQQRRSSGVSFGVVHFGDDNLWNGIRVPNGLSMRDRVFYYRGEPVSWKMSASVLAERPDLVAFLTRLHGPP